MDHKKTEDLEQMAQDIQCIRSALFRNRELIRQWTMSASLHFAAFYSGIVIGLFSALYYGFISYYNSYAAIPMTARTVLLLTFIIMMAVPAMVKIRTLLRLKDNYPHTSYPGMFFKVFGPSVLACWLILLIIMLVLFIYACYYNLLQFSVPVICILIGLLSFIFGSQFSLIELGMTGLWQIVSGLLSIPFIAATPKNGWLWLGIGLGASFFVFTLISRVKGLLKRSEP